MGWESDDKKVNGVLSMFLMPVAVPAALLAGSFDAVGLLLLLLLLAPSIYPMFFWNPIPDNVAQQMHGHAVPYGHRKSHATPYGHRGSHPMPYGHRGSHPMPYGPGRV